MLGSSIVIFIGITLFSSNAELEKIKFPLSVSLFAY